MKKRWILIVTAVVTAAIVMTLGFLGANRSGRGGGKEILLRVTQPVGDLKEMGEIQRSDAKWGGSYAGDFLLEDDIYQYFVNPTGEYIEAILLKPVELNRGIELPTQSAAEEFFRKNYPFQIEGELTINQTFSGNNDCIYEIIEKQKGFETGTKASMIVSEQGFLASASFLLADYESFAKLDLEKLIPAAEAMVNICSEIDAELGETKMFRVPGGHYDAVIKTFQGQTYWEISFRGIVYDEQMNMEESGYTCKVDAFTGVVLEIAKSV